MKHLRTKAERRAFLRAHGWEQLGWGGAGMWRHPLHPREHFTLAAAYAAARREQAEREAA